MTSTPNPLCGCGCGQEVARPWNRYIHGHYCKRKGVRKLSVDDVLAIRKARRKGVSGYKLAKVYGVSTAWIYYVAEFRVGNSEYGRAIVRREELERQIKFSKDKREWQKGKKQLKVVRSLLRDPQKLQSAAFQQGQTSQT